METILTSLYIPTIGESYDIFAPTDLVISELTKLLAQGVLSISGGKYIISGMELLMIGKPEELLNPKKTLADYGCADGTVLVMI